MRATNKLPSDRPVTQSVDGVCVGYYVFFIDQKLLFTDGMEFVVKKLAIHQRVIELVQTVSVKSFQTGVF